MEGVKKKKKPVPKNSLCKICGDKANDHLHFGASKICYSCKAFFRRIVKGNVAYSACQFSRICQITVENRSTCQDCRYQKVIVIKHVDKKWVTQTFGNGVIRQDFFPATVIQQMCAMLQQQKTKASMTLSKRRLLLTSIKKMDFKIVAGCTGCAKNFSAILRPFLKTFPWTDFAKVGRIFCV